MEYVPALQKMIALQRQIQDIHPLFARLYPVAVVEGDQLLIYDLDPAGQAYRLVMQAPTPMPIPVGVRAAFPLECYDGRSACVVTGDAFDSLAGYVTIFHEFVHCHQAATCELALKSSLEVAQRARAAGDFMWEIEHPFPYTDPGFVEAYTTLLEAAQDSQGEAVLQAHSRLKALLPPLEVEYLCWQEWKEGLARLLENRLQARLGLPENHYGRQPPYHRITLYEGGAALIAALEGLSPGLLQDLEGLFEAVKTTPLCPPI